jgi:hypothetical protein
MTGPVLKSDSRLERVLRSGRFAVTAELNPPDSADSQAVYERALVLASVCDAINATDASGAHVHMSSVAVCAMLTRAGSEPCCGFLLRRVGLPFRAICWRCRPGVRNVLPGRRWRQVGDQPE